MKMKYIVMLREEVHTGKGFAKRFDAEGYRQDMEMVSFISFTTMDGVAILINKNNVKSITKVEEGKCNY